MSTRRKQFPLWAPLILGLMGVSRVFENPRLAAIRTIDIVQLVGIGICVGVALATLVTFLRRPRE